MRTIIDTVYFQGMMVSNIMGNTYRPIQGTTINEYLNIPIVETDGNPSITHYTLGLAKIEQEAVLDSLEHSPLDITLYNMIPLLMVEKDVDILTPAEESEYDLGKELVVDGKTYMVYYAKKLDNKDTRTSLYDVKWDGESNKYDIKLFKFEDSMLGKPTPKPGKDYVFDNSQPSVAVSSTVSVSLSLKDVDNIKKVITILYPNSTSLITDRIFEVGIVASNKDSGYYQHTHYKKVNKLINSLTLEGNTITGLDIGAMSPINI